MYKVVMYWSWCFGGNAVLAWQRWSLGVLCGRRLLLDENHGRLVATISVGDQFECLWIFRPRNEQGRMKSSHMRNCFEIQEINSVASLFL